MVGEDDYVCLDIRAVDCSVGHRLFGAKVEVLGTKIWGVHNSLAIRGWSMNLARLSNCFYDIL